MIPVIFPIEGLSLTDPERHLIRTWDPYGFILFNRPGRKNIDTPDQVRALTDDIRAACGRADCPILIDQEGGRVARMGPPHWPSFLPYEHYGQMYTSDPEESRRALASDTAGIARLLNDAGINVNCAPVMDLRYPGAHDIIGNRSFGADPDMVADLADVVCRTYLDHGITPVIKHAPGHGRALADSHLDLPRVDVPYDELVRTDFRPFTLLSQKPYASRVWMMTAHILYPELDPVYPATLSSNIIHNVIREEIGFPGTIIGDDLYMKALDPYGDVPARAAASLAAGCDLALDCFGAVHDLEKVAQAVSKMGKTLA